MVSFFNVKNELFNQFNEKLTVKSAKFFIELYNPIAELPDAAPSAYS